LLTKQSEMTSASARAVRRICELDGLRCFLSWWVVLDHILLSSGFRYETLPPLVRILTRGDYAVDVFIILSGFVITMLLAEKREGYVVFVVRRFFRLFPVFAVTLLIGILLRPVLGWILAVGWPADPVTLRISWVNWESESQHFWMHLLAHLPMLHGVVPNNILPSSALAFVGSAWSTSLEWQYYLVAPLLVLICKRFGPIGWFALGSISILVLLRCGTIMDSLFPMQSFLLQKLLLFLVGGSCYCIFTEVRGKHEDLPWLLFFFVAPAVLWFTLSVPLAIWTAAFALTLGANETRGLSKFRALLNLPWVQRLGEISFSTYLGHVSCIGFVQWCILILIPQVDQQRMFLGLLIGATPLTIVVSELLFRYVEKPGIRLGRRLTRAEPERKEARAISMEGQIAS
jgi:peptidoglycan/LPS O-acetylase OafA/YrhL